MRRLFILVVCLLMLLSPASAHSGGTDSKGGHYDHSTGEYHYHHGHPAHQHDNGECPYNFDDQTGKKSGSSSKDSSKSKSSQDKTPSTKKSALSELWGIVKGLLTGLACFVGLCLILYAPHYLIEQIKKMRQFRKEKAAYEKLYKERNPIDLVNKPRFTIIGADGLPRQTPSREGWGELYTVYVTERGQAYHQRRGCCYATRQMHIYHASQSRRPCKVCCRDVPDLTWYSEYLRIKQIKQKYRIN